MFVDEARIHIKAGSGGKGCESFYKDNYMRYPRPDGGDGGRGGNIIFKAQRGKQTLLDFKFKQHYKAESGRHASSKGKQGRNGKDCILNVPMGTIIKDFETKLILKDLTDDQQTVIAALGGTGGVGNQNNRTPHPPKEGEEKTVVLELKIIADVGLIGFPNAGKSTLISKVSKVKSKIANYPFTTRHPILGYVDREDKSFIIADLPGIIEGAHSGKGLGDKFLKHAERTKLIVHVVDMAGSEGRDPIEDYEKINHELECYEGDLALEGKIIVANKMDLPQAAGNFKKFKKKIKKDILPVSSLNGEGLDALVDVICERLC